LRVALVHDWLTGMRGGEKVLEQIGAIFPDAPIYTLFHFPGSVSAAIESHPIHTSFLQRAPGLRRHYRRYLPLFPAAIEDFDLAGFDLVISSSHCVAKGIIPPPDGFHVCYCHTPMRYAWDQEHAYFPRRRGMLARVRALTLTALRAWDAAAAPRVDLFIANSSFVARRIRAFYGRDAEVVHPPVAVDYFTPAPPPARSPASMSASTPAPASTPAATPAAAPASTAAATAAAAPASTPPSAAAAAAAGGRRGGYALAVSALAPYKRIEIAIAACAHAGIELRIAGDGPERQRLARLAGDGARLLGRVGDEELRDLYRGARMLVQPGVEDFGIAAVESLACGTPVVAAARGGVLDVVVDGCHGVLYEDRLPGGPTPAAGAPCDPRDLPAVLALAAAIDKAMQMSWNPLDLRNRAESFAAGPFADRIRSLVASNESRALMSRQVSRARLR
jgi:glycosyltransferase involved in cell wall biosynthesis